MGKRRTIKYHKIPLQGDIGIVKSDSFIGDLIGFAFREDSPLQWPSGRRPSNHTFIYGFSRRGIPCAFEALLGGFTATPFSVYIDEVRLGRCDLKIVRPKDGLTARQLLDANLWLNEHLGTPYDFRAYVSHIWRIVLRMAPLVAIECKSRFYCTEAAQMCYSFIGRTELSDVHMIAPIHPEKKTAEGLFEIVAEVVEE